MPDRRYIRAVIPAGQGKDAERLRLRALKAAMINNSFDMGRPNAVVLSELAELFAEAKNR